MRTPVDLDADALIAARHVAQREHVSLGDALSELIHPGVEQGREANSA